MLQQGPGDEHVALTAYERRQFELIERSLASEDPRLPREHRTDTEGHEPNPLWIALVIACAWIMLLGVVVGGVVLVLVGSAGAAAAFVMYRRSRHRTDWKQTDADDTDRA